MRLVLRLVPGAFLAASTACGSDSLAPLTALPRELTVAEQQLLRADNAFAFSLFREVNRQEEAGRNVFISPLSAAMALGMAYNGAAGTTRDAMADALELQGMSINDMNQAYRSLIDLLRELDAGVEFRIANSIWHRPALVPLQPFQEATRAFFDATVEALDFSRPDAAATMNQWVDQNTNGRIKDIVPDPVPDYIVLYLINAIYFKGDWTNQFDQGQTRERPFRLADGTDLAVPMMSGDGSRGIRTVRGDGVTVVELPYSRQAFAMTIVLPDDAAGAATLATELTQERWDEWTSGLGGSVLVSLPKFRIEYALRLNDVLKALGMAEAFDPCRADFTNMFAPRAAERFYLDDARQKTFVDVNEEGTEAAAATSVGVGATSAPSRIEVDRPFLFAIRERLSGSILFIGKIMNPRANEAREIESPPEQCAS